MYKKFFGFKERPFKLVPNPAYLFLSRSHEEALAHLSYAISQGDGFVEITGEVGTGKTTLCRAFLETLDENTEAAYIFNPKLDAIQLLKAINDEFAIRSEPDNTKDLIDILNAFLIEKKGQGKKVILLVDEAQNLSVEVLEQLRLLSNLETTTSKLLQIILVGQPELGDMLDSYDLRQLGQRITLSCHIHPMTRNETRQYILHRIHTASQKPGVTFTWAAFFAIYRYSRGIPRQINIVCDRALLFAYGLNRHIITGSIVKASARELAGRGDIRKFGLQVPGKSTVVLAAVCVALFLYILFRPEGFQRSDSYKNAKNKEAR
ncbi:MAG: AAA family ATPase, partial [Deltaproteobacteria bacterium]|nr:AAA family ATPase [Deltaproteobacteria bacterium]